MFGKQTNKENVESKMLFSLSYNIHLIKHIACTSKLIDQKRQVTHIKRYIAALFGVEYNVAHRVFPAAVEIDAYQVVFGIAYRAS